MPPVSRPDTLTIPYEQFLTLAFMIAALAVVVAIPPYHDLYRSFISNSDMDVESAYQALLILNREPLLFTPHTAYGYNLVLALWVGALNLLGMVDTVSLGTIIASAEFDRLFTQIVAAGRILSIVLSIAIVVLVYVLARMLQADPLPAALAAWLTATTPGLMTHTVMLRTELPSMLLILTAAIFVLAPGSSGPDEGPSRRASWKPFGFLFAAAFAIVYAMMIKVQAVFLLPIVLALPFLAPRPRNPPRPLPQPAAAMLFIATALASGSTLVLVYGVLDLSRGIPYQAVLPLLTATAIVIYGRIHTLSAAVVAQGLAAATAGAAVAFHLNYLMDQWWTPYAIVNYVDFMAFEAQKLGNSTERSHWSPTQIILAFGGAARDLIDVVLTQAKKKGPLGIPVRYGLRGWGHFILGTDSATTVAIPTLDGIFNDRRDHRVDCFRTARDFSYIRYLYRAVAIHRGGAAGQCRHEVLRSTDTGHRIYSGRRSGCAVLVQHPISADRPKHRHQPARVVRLLLHTFRPTPRRAFHAPLPFARRDMEDSVPGFTISRPKGRNTAPPGHAVLALTVAVPVARIVPLNEISAAVSSSSAPAA